MQELSVAEVGKHIYQVRGVRVMLDRDLAWLFQTETRTLNQMVRRNPERFPEDLMFKLDKDEFEELKLHSTTSKTGGRGGQKKLPLAFTEPGVNMLSCTLNSDRAIQVSLTAVRAFIQLREVTQAQLDIVKRFDEFEARYEERFQAVLAAVQRQAIGPSVQVENSSVSRPQADLELQRVIPRGKSPSSIYAIQEVVAQYFGLEVENLKSLSRAITVVLPRQVAIYLIRKNTMISFKEIGKVFGGRDHSTILHACQKIEAAIAAKDPFLQGAVESLEGILVCRKIV